MKVAKLFRHGGSQAVRLPKEFRMSGTEVMVHQKGDTVVLEPIRSTVWPKGFFRKIRITEPGFKRPDQGKIPPIRDL